MSRHSTDAESSGRYQTPVYTSGNLEEAARILRDGGLVVFPTETVYGLGASALNDAAVARIFAAKGRPQDNPLIVHLAAVSQLGEVAERIPPSARLLLQAFSPGPLTVVLPRAASISPRVSAGLSSVGVRIPSHPVAREFLQQCGVPVAAPSANISGRPSPTSLAMAMNGLDGRVDAAVDGGESRHGIESTVVRCGEDEVVVLRPGTVSLEMIRECVSRELPKLLVKARSATPVARDMESDKDVESNRNEHLGGYEPANPVKPTNRPEPAESPGTRHRHYQPDAALVISESLERSLETHAARTLVSGRRVGIIALFRAPENLPTNAELIVMESLEDYARKLYRSFVRYDDIGCDVILAELPSDAGLGRALRDRLQRAADGRVI